MANRLIVPVIEAEKLSFDAFDTQELKKMFRLSFEHVKQLEKLVGKISDNSKGEDEWKFSYQIIFHIANL